MGFNSGFKGLIFQVISNSPANFSDFQRKVLSGKIFAQLRVFMQTLSKA